MKTYKKVFIATAIVGFVLGTWPNETYYKTPPEAIKAPRTIVKHKKAIYQAPQGKALEIALYVSQETSQPLDTISQIMWAESGYRENAKHINNNKSVDSGYFQINSQHIPLAKSMGIDIHTPQGNADFAIYLIKQRGLSPWSFSQSKWGSL